jgi:riboflavin kinase/FMN adenylyltransferase
MILIQNIKEIENFEIALTIGNFDGVHLGHQDFLSHIRNECDLKNRKLLVVTFVPHPSFVLKSKSNFLLNTYKERRDLLQDLGVDFLLEIDFNRDFSTLSPEDFLNDYIFTNKLVKKIYLGHDFQFGANKAGNFSVAKKQAEMHGVELVLYSEFKVSSHSVSSSEVREKINLGNVKDARDLLGRNFFLSGRVIKGQGRGKQIGYPTANLGYDKDVIVPAKGVYISKTNLNGMIYESVTNVGVNPTFNSGYDLHVETHILGFSRDIYGEEIKIFFIQKLRDEKKFSSVNELVQQIAIDTQSAKKFFEKT